MGAVLDMNSFDINNVDDLNAGSVYTTALVLNGKTVTTTTTLTGGLAASEVTYNAKALNDALDDDFPTIAGNETITGAWNFNGVTTFNAAVGIGGTTPLALTDIAGEMTFDSRTGEDGTRLTKINWNGSAGHGGDFSISRGLQFVGGVQEKANSGDGACQILFNTDTVDAQTKIRTWDNNDAGGVAAGVPESDYIQFGNTGTHRWEMFGTTRMELTLIGLDVKSGNIKFPATATPSLDSYTLDDYREGRYTAAITCATSGTIPVNTAADQLAYTKIGRLVTVTGRILIGTPSSPLGNITINLPFAIGTSTEGTHWLGVPIYARNMFSLADGFTLVGTSVGAATNAMSIHKLDFTDANLELISGTNLYFNFSYLTDE
jgi:hypothetical protein